jgi:hypothetical protein
MNSVSGEQPYLRVSDADRDSAMAELGDHFQAGRLDNEEFGQRLDAAASARTRADLDQLLADLPRPVPAAPHIAPQRGRQAAAVAAVLGSIAIAALSVTIVAGAFGGWGGNSHEHGGPVHWWIIVIPIILLARLARGARGTRRGPH